MSLVRKVLVCFMMFALFFPFISPINKSFAASTSDGLTPMTDSLAIQMENGETVISDKVSPDLVSAKDGYIMKLSSQRLQNQQLQQKQLIMQQPK